MGVHSAFLGSSGAACWGLVHLAQGAAEARAGPSGDQGGSKLVPQRSGARGGFALYLHRAVLGVLGSGRTSSLPALVFQRLLRVSRGLAPPGSFRALAQSGGARERRVNPSLVAQRPESGADGL